MANRAWCLRRLRAMTPAEIVDRARHEAVKMAWKRRQIRPGQPDPMPLPRAVPRFATPLPELAVPEAARLALLRAADHVMDGRWELFGSERCMFGSNFPMVMPADCLDQVGELGLDAETLSLFLGGNAERVFKL